MRKNNFNKDTMQIRLNPNSAGTIILLCLALNISGLCNNEHQITQQRHTQLHAALNTLSSATSTDAKVKSLQHINSLIFIKSARDSGMAASLVPFLHDSDPNVRRQTISVLGHLEDSNSEALITKLALHDSDPDVRLDAVWAMAVCGKENALPTLRKLMSDPSVKIQVRAAASLGILGNREGYSLAFHYLSNPDEDIKNEAAMALGQIGNKDALDPIRLAIKNQSVRTNVGDESIILIELNQRHTPSDKLAYLSKAVKTDDGDFAEAAAWSFSRYQDDPTFMSALVLIANDKTNPGSWAAKRVARTLGLIQ